MKKMFTIVCLLTINLQAIASPLEDQLPIVIQNEKKSFDVSPIALGLTRAITGSAGIFTTFVTGYILYAIPNTLIDEIQKKMWTGIGASFATPILLGGAIVSGIYTVKKAKAIHQARKKKQQQRSISKISVN